VKNWFHKALIAAFYIRAFCLRFFPLVIKEKVSLAQWLSVDLQVSSSNPSRNLFQKVFIVISVCGAVRLLYPILKSMLPGLSGKQAALNV
jgi:hypothetical protein